jgi:LytS/YehU family sensor histidine kinase
VDKETDTLTYYLEMQKLRFNESFEFKISTSGIPDTSEIAIPSMMLQPVIENAVEHGLRDVITDGEIVIDLTLTGNKMRVTIEDNGSGYEPKQTRPTDSLKLNKHKSLSTKIIKERIEGFNKKAGKKEFSIEYRNLTNEATEVKGTRVTLILPIKESILEK